jgi:hypothetical protein
MITTLRECNGNYMTVYNDNYMAEYNDNYITRV